MHIVLIFSLKNDKIVDKWAFLLITPQLLTSSFIVNNLQGLLKTVFSTLKYSIQKQYRRLKNRRQYMVHTSLFTHQTFGAGREEQHVLSPLHGGIGRCPPW